MLPAYGCHLRSHRSLLVRYAGIYCIKLPGQKARYVTIMLSVLDPSCKIDEIYDVKGSMHKRRKKPKEKVGKDEDWVASSRRLQLPDTLRREIRAAHEMDATLLRSFGLMDYSFLIGIHNATSSPEAGAGWREPCGVWSRDKSQIYFIGLIDFLIHFGLKKKTEHLLKTAAGHELDASCVDPDFYAIRQVDFFKSHVLEVPGGELGRRPKCKYAEKCYRKNPEHKKECCHPGDPDWALPDPASGTLGALRVTFIAGHNLIRADLFGQSDPYGRACLGSQQVRTPTVTNDCNPEWNCDLCLAVDSPHRDLDLELSVWDDDFHVVQGSDDKLGVLYIPMSQVLRDGKMEFRKTLQDVRHGELSVRLEFSPL